MVYFLIIWKGTDGHKKVMQTVHRHRTMGIN